MSAFDPTGLLIAAGRQHNWTSDIKYGSNPAVKQAWAEIWSPGGSAIINNTATIAELTSTTASDAGGESGARTVSIFGVDTDFVLQEETVTLTGTDAASTVGSYLYVTRLKVLTAGSALGNLGAISAAVGGSTMGHIPSGSGQSVMLHKAIPAGAIGYLTGIGVAVTKGADVDIRICEYDQVGQVWRVKLDLHSFEATAPVRFIPPYRFPAKHLVVVEGKTSNASGFAVDAWTDYIISQGDT